MPLPFSKNFKPPKPPISASLSGGLSVKTERFLIEKDLQLLDREKM
jgi:hypothetical protein